MASSKRYVALRGGNYRADGQDAVEGEVYSDIPSDQLDDLVARNVVREVTAEDQASSEPTKEQLLDRAKALGIEGRSGMDKDTLASAVESAERNIDQAPDTARGGGGAQ